jgi:hypothetical protein
VAGRPLRPATDRRLGRPLPYQLANPTSAHPSTRGLTSPRFPPKGVCGISQSFDWLFPIIGQIPKHCSPVRRSSARIATPVTARLACVRHAASVQSEPGSNSSLKDLRTSNQRVSKGPLLDFLVTRLMSPKESLTRVPTQITCKFLDSTTAAEGRRRGRNYRPEPNSVNFVSNIYLTHRAWARRPSVREGAHYREGIRSVNAQSQIASDFA